MYSKMKQFLHMTHTWKTYNYFLRQHLIPVTVNSEECRNFTDL